MLSKKTRIALLLITVGNLGAAAFSAGCAIMSKNEFRTAASHIAGLAVGINQGMTRIEARLNNPAE